MMKYQNIDPQTIDPDKIQVSQIDAGKMVFLQKRMSKAIWKPAPGRKLAFMVKHESDLLGLIFLASPVINMSARDNILNLSKDKSEKGKQLRNVADLSVCVSSQPFGWRWNGGKLMAMIATTLGDFWEQRYNDKLSHVVTTSLWGKGAQYNKVYKFIGYTKGYGHEHIPEEKYKDMLKWMKDNNIEIPSCSFGAGSNAKMRRISAYRKASGDMSVNLKHKKIRGIYIHEAIDPLQRNAVIHKWYEKWGYPRFTRKVNEIPPYNNGLTNTIIDDTQEGIEKFL